MENECSELKEKLDNLISEFSQVNEKSKQQDVELMQTNEELCKTKEKAEQNKNDLLVINENLFIKVETLEQNLVKLKGENEIKLKTELERFENEQKIIRVGFEEKMDNLEQIKAGLEFELENSQSEIVKFRENLEIRDTELNQIKIELEITKKSSENQDDLDKIKFELEETRQKLKTLENSESLLEQVKLFDLYKKCIKSKYF